jgi:hypothetical protein
MDEIHMPPDHLRECVFSALLRIASQQFQIRFVHV